jgi:hypothetical protein
VFKNSAAKAAEYADTARSVATGIFGGLVGLGAKAVSASANPPATPITNAPTSLTSNNRNWAKWASYGGAVLAAGAAAGTVYYKRDDLALGYGWATDHMKYIGNLWDENAMRKRVESIIDIEQEMGVLFRTYVPFNLVCTKSCFQFLRPIDFILSFLLRLCSISQRGRL